MSVGARDLCTLAHVVGYAPGYDANVDTNGDRTLAKLQDLITEESTSQLNRGREFRAIAGANPRVFDLTATHLRRRRLRVGDASAITTVTIVDNLGSTVETVAATDRVSLPRVRQEWEPIRTLWFPPSSPQPAQLGCGWTVSVSATWGFPAVPTNVREAVAKLVLIRWVTEVAPEGTAFSDALQDVNVGQLLETAAAVLDSYADPGIA